MNRELAEDLNHTFLELSAKIDKSIGVVLSECDKEVATTYRQLGGMVMGLIFTNLLMLVYGEHPDLTPARLKEARREEPGSIPVPISNDLLALIDELKEQLQRALLRVMESSAPEGEGSFQQAVQEILDAVENTAEFVRRRTEGMAAAAT